MSSQDQYRKKHRRQMTQAEVDAVIELPPTGSAVTFSAHAREQLIADLGGNEGIIRAIFDDDFAQVPEFAWHPIDRKWKLVVRGKSGWCAVVTQDGTIPSVWYNDPNDTHSTLNLNVYDASLDILKCLQEARG